MLAGLSFYHLLRADGLWHEIHAARSWQPRHAPQAGATAPLSAKERACGWVHSALDSDVSRARADPHVPPGHVPNGPRDGFRRAGLGRFRLLHLQPWLSKTLRQMLASCSADRACSGTSTEHDLSEPDGAATCMAPRAPSPLALQHPSRRRLHYAEGRFSFPPAHMRIAAGFSRA